MSKKTQEKQTKTKQTKKKKSFFKSISEWLDKHSEDDNCTRDVPKW